MERGTEYGLEPVSYTHLDVYKRQEMYHYDGVPASAEKKVVVAENDIKTLYDKDVYKRQPRHRARDGSRRGPSRQGLRWSPGSLLRLSRGNASQNAFHNGSQKTLGFAPGSFSYVESRAHGISFYERTSTSTEHAHPNGNVVFLTLGNRVSLRPRDTREEPLDDKCA